jgi:hypothetical protein
MRVWELKRRGRRVKGERGGLKDRERHLLITNLRGTAAMRRQRERKQKMKKGKSLLIAEQPGRPVIDGVERGKDVRKEKSE